MATDIQGKLTEALKQISNLENRLSKQEARLKYFVQHAPAAMAMLDTDLKYIAASHKYEADWIGKRTKKAREVLFLTRD